MTSPQQEIYLLCKNVCVDLFADRDINGNIDYKHINVYDFLPNDDAEYPFVMIGESFSMDDPNKTAIFGNYTQTIHVHHNRLDERYLISEKLNDIVTELRKAKQTPSFFVHILSHNQQVMIDQVGNQQYLHGVLEIQFKFYGKGR